MAAVSGGPDSVALLHALLEIAPTAGFTVRVTHLNHCIRGEDAMEDAAFVEAMASKLNLPFIPGKTDVPALASKKGISIEMAAREARIAFFKRAVRKSRSTCVATGHTADDQAETVLLKLARGAGCQGLSAMCPLTDIEGLRMIRPMLGTTRTEVMSFLKQRGLEWREDRTNRDDSFLRNRVRHHVLPFLEKNLNPRIREALVRTALIANDENNWLKDLTSRLLTRCVTRGERGSIDIAQLMETHPAAMRRVLRMWLISCGVVPELIDFNTVDRLGRLAAAKKGSGSAPVPGGGCVRRQYGKLVFLEEHEPPSAPVFREALKTPGETVLPAIGLRVLVSREPGIHRERGSGPGCLPARASLSSNAVGRKTMFVRSWRNGDRMSPYGLDGSRKIQDIFVDCKVPADKRTTVPLIECGGKIIWIPGYRVAEGWHVTDPKAGALQILAERV